MNLLKIEDPILQKKIAKQALLERRRLASSINTLWAHAKQNGYPIGIITAFRGMMVKRKKKFPRYSYAENLRRNEKLKEELKKFPVSWVPIEGAWIEGAETPQAHEVSEKSFFVVGNLMSNEDFKKLLTSLGTKFNQDGVIFKPSDSNEVICIGTQDFDEDGNRVTFPGLGNEIPFGPFHPSKIGLFYSKLRGHPFTFTSIAKDPEGKMGAAFSSFINKEPEVI